MLRSLALAMLPLADGAAAPQRAADTPGIMNMVLMFGSMFAIFYFLLLRPQRKAEQERVTMQGKIKKNDHVITSGGLKGVVTSVKDDEVTLKVDETNNVRIRFQRSAIVQVVSEGAEASPDTADGGSKA
jgi:preprotein translocase subunit YajC